MAPSRRRGVFGTYWFVFASSATTFETVVMRPVSCAKCARALLNWFVSAPGINADVNRLNAGSQGLPLQVAVDMPSDTWGTVVCAFSHADERRYPPPMLKAWAPFCQFSELSTV